MDGSNIARSEAIQIIRDLRAKLDLAGPDKATGESES